MIGLARRAIVIACLLLAWPALADAQSLLPPGKAQTAAEETAQGDVAAAIREAADKGVSVIVIDSAGKVVSTEPAEADPAPPAAAPPPETDRASGLMRAQAHVSTFRATLRERLDALPVSLNEVAYILRATSPDGRIVTYLELLAWSALFLLIARFLTVHIYGQRIVRNFVVSRVRETPVGYREKMPFLVMRFVTGLGGTLIAMALAYTMHWLVLGFNQDLSIQFSLTAIYLTFFLTRTVSDIWRMILSPFLPQYRIPRFSDRDAKRLYYWASVVAFFNISTIIFSTWIHDFGLNYNVYAIVYGGTSLLGALLNIAMVVFNARAVTNAIRNGRPLADVSWLTGAISCTWAPVLVGYIAFGWLVLASQLVLELPERIPLVVGAYVVFLSIMVVYGAINFLIERYFDRRMSVERLNAELAAADAEEDGAPAGPIAPRPRITTYEDLARRVAGIIAFVAGAYALLRIWDPGNAVLSESIVGRLLDVTTILFIGYIVYTFFRIWIDSRIAEESVTEAEVELGDEGGGSTASRLGTLLPLFRGGILAIVVVAIGLIALLELGINVSPLFAGAGVVGLAVGFGAQTLVRDVFSGAFFLIDDAFRKGEYIDIENVKGTVEKISVRSFQLRHHLGALHTIPFGEIKVLTNYSRDWVIMKLPLRVTYDTDVEKVRKLVKALGQELLSDPVIGDSFLQPLKSQGVIEMQDSAMIIRVKFMTKPGDQWLIRKRVYEEIRALFAREGIRFAHREVTVRLADGHIEHLTPEQRDTITGAALSALDDDALEDMKGVGGDDR